LGKANISASTKIAGGGRTIAIAISQSLTAFHRDQLSPSGVWVWSKLWVWFLVHSAQSAVGLSGHSHGRKQDFFPAVDKLQGLGLPFPAGSRNIARYGLRQSRRSR